jgi:hypothetical protein
MAAPTGQEPREKLLLTSLPRQLMALRLGLPACINDADGIQVCTMQVRRGHRGLGWLSCLFHMARYVSLTHFCVLAWI